MRARMILFASVLAGVSSMAQAAPACEVSSSGISFGVVNALRPGARSSVGFVSVACHGEGEARVVIGIATDDPNRRERMFDEAGHGPGFVLFLDPAHQRPWGDGSAGTDRIERRIQGDDRVVQVPVYAALRMTAAESPGVYARRLSLMVDVADANDP